MPSKKGVSKAEAKADSQSEKNSEPEEEKASEVQKEETVDKVDGTKSTEKRGRGRPKKDEGPEPTIKKPKKVKQKNQPSRSSSRVANMKSGATLPDVVEELKKKDVNTKKAQQNPQEEKKDLSSSNGATEQAVES